MKLIKEYNKNITKFTIIGLLTFTSLVKAQPGSLDLSFNGNGKFISGSIGNSESVALQSNGKIILGGSLFSSSWAFGVKRCNTNGTIDNTFGINGSTVIDINPNLDFGRAIAIQTDDKIVIAGQSDNGSNDDVTVVRLNSNGTIDNTFGTNGIVTTTISSFSEKASAIAIQPDGKIVVGGSANTGTSSDFIIIRYNTNGTLDNTFGVNGIVLTDIGLASDDQIKTIDLQSDGKIVAGGIYNASGYDFCLVRYNTNGTIDNTFGNAGKVITAITSGVDEIESIDVQSDGKIVVVGNSNITANTDFVLVRYNTTGSLDNTFGNLGIVTTTVGLGGDYASSVKIQTNGKIVVMGYIQVGADNDAAIVRYNSNGTLDNTFGLGGKVISPIGSTYDFVLDGILDNNGKIILSGNFDNSMGAARFIGECNLNTSVAVSGLNLTSNQIGTYQWLNCANAMAQILNETNQTYTATTNGSYAVQITNNGCIDTSVCINIVNVGINERTRDIDFGLFPNPSNGIFNLILPNPSRIILINMLGQQIQNQMYGEGLHQFDLLNQASGVYFIKVISENKQQSIKLIKE
ncbi:MAG: T9SS type A sorting domain-containing protein [Bacteroidia bacterium]|nr:T9SS type A sorting domain-containing protein [Bacteroidia bacterium]